ncbi:Lrp/AsnC family transcriptional regulator [Pokkaliibacter sp. MBI-7]|uniref:Lrp/AsnC family transcriptional regulator n=1 Tax=Pokkaliibacter sp. MBI-7 TaxID=3040600 RepID=UPI002446D4B7|nr:Lrp/AsnC family transcriptional regulator [Pokkaliibacter sp. MBI-7]MDH2433745.1 Lrp/AsnC family transcriptional regulator [Pokkaliibacter sp. MBI-7]
MTATRATGMAIVLDKRDKRILEYLQQDASMPVAELAEKVDLSVSACWRRIKALEESGLILKRVALVDRKKANLPMTVFVGVKTSRHSMEWFEAFQDTIATIPEIVEAYRLTGNIDYLLRLVVPDIDAYDRVYKRLISKLDFTDVTSFISMEELKFTTAVPVSYI